MKQNIKSSQSSDLNTESTPDHQRSIQRSTLFVAIITSYITAFTGSALNLSVPAISGEFHASAALTGWIVNGYILSCAALSVPFGRIADITGRKRILVSGIGIFALFSGLVAFSWSMPVLLSFRILQGLGAAMIFSTNIAVLISAFPPEKRGWVLGTSVASTYIGLSTGPVIGGFLNHELGWRSIFLFTLILSLIVLVNAIRRIQPLPPESAGESMDFLGTFLFIGTVLSLMYGLSSFSTVAFSFILIPIGALLLWLFVWYEQKIAHPIIQVSLFRQSRSYAFSNLAALLSYGATFAIGYLLSLYLQLVVGLNSQVSGLVLISQPLVMAVLSPAAGKLSDRISPFKLASFGMGLTSLGLFSFIFIREDYPMWLMILNLIVIGTGFAFFSSPNTNAIMSCVEQRDYSVASSILATMRTMGQSSSMAIITFIFASKLGNQLLADVPPATLVSVMHSAFILFTGICLIGIFISLQRKSIVKTD